VTVVEEDGLLVCLEIVVGGAMSALTVPPQPAKIRQIANAVVVRTEVGHLFPIKECTSTGRS
jgi:hypothetical protein